MSLTKGESVLSLLKGESPPLDIAETYGFAGKLTGEEINRGVHAWQVQHVAGNNPGDKDAMQLPLDSQLRMPLTKCSCR